MQTFAKPDPFLHSYIQILQTETKFKAKVIYTLSCIQNTLSSSPTTFITNLQYLSRYQDVFAQIARLYGESSVMEPLAEIFYRFQAIGVGGACMKFLDLLEKTKIEGSTSDRLIEYICKMLNLLKHRYPKTKEICLKLLENQETKLSQNQTQIVLSTMANSSTISKSQFLQLGKFSKINIPPIKILELMWRSGLKTNEKNDNKQKEVELEVMNKYLIDGWSDQVIKYACLRTCIWNSTSSIGFVEQISPKFFDRFLKNGLKPYYPLEDKNKGIDICTKFKQTVEHCSNEYGNQNLSSQMAEIIPFFSHNADYTEILTSISSNKQITKRNQVRYHPLIAIQLLTYPQAILPKLQLNPKPSQAFKVLKKLQNIPVDFNNEMVMKIYLLILQIYLCHKQCTYLKQIQWILKFSVRNSLKSFLLLVDQNIQYILFAPFALKSINQLNSQQKLSFLKSVDMFIGSQTLKLQYKFYIAAKLVKLRQQKSVYKFINYLLRNLNKDELPYQEIAFYLKNYEVTEEDVQWIYTHFEEQLERIQQKIFGKLAAFDFKAPKQIIFALQKLDVFQQWLPIYRWTLNPLDEPNFDNCEGLVDSLEVFQTVIENCQNIPIEIIKSK